jgi:CheY-like chemotaxis protein
MVFEDDRPIVQGRIAAVLRRETPPPIEHRIVHRDGSFRWVRNTVVPRHDDQGRLVGYDGLVKDITDRRKIEDQLRHAQKMEAIGQLTAGIAHDFNNILTAMIGYGTVIRMGMGEDDEDVRNVLVSILGTYGYNVISAIDGSDAVHKYRKHKDQVELLLFDLVMPKKTGREAYEEIKKMRPGIKALFSSGYPPGIIRERALLDDHAAVIFKPISPSRLLEKVRNALDKGKTPLC